MAEIAFIGGTAVGFFAGFLLSHMNNRQLVALLKNHRDYWRARYVQTDERLTKMVEDTLEAHR